MKVSELIAELQKLDPELQVAVYDGMDPADYVVATLCGVCDGVYVPLENDEKFVCIT